MQFNADDTGQTGPKIVYWRVEGSLLDLSTVRPLAFFAWNAQTFTERWVRRGAIFLQAVLRPFLYAANRVFATRFVHTILRGVSRDRLNLLGEEYFQYVLRPQLRPRAVELLQQKIAQGNDVVLVSQGLEHIMRPLAEYLGVQKIICNRLDFRDGSCTGRLLEPVIRPRGALALLVNRSADGSRDVARLCRNLGLKRGEQALHDATRPVTPEPVVRHRRIVRFDSRPAIQRLSVRESLAGKHILLIGVTGFIGKVWLAQILQDLPEIGGIYLLVRKQKSNPAARRFWNLVEESPVFDTLHSRYKEKFADFLSRRIRVLEGDAGEPDFNLDPKTLSELRANLDVVINSSGLTDFNPDLRDALSANVDAVLNVLSFVQQCDHAALLHLSTCYVAGDRDGRVEEELHPNYTPAGVPGFDAEQEIRSLREVIATAEARAQGLEITAELRQQAQAKANGKELSGVALENQVRKNRIRWLRNYLTTAGTRRARELGWPNTYTLTKSLAESLIRKLGGDLPVAIVRPAIVETSIHSPFLGWNEGINTSASLSYLLGTYFRQLPSNERKRLDIIPVDTVGRAMTLISAALVSRCHEPLYQLATSVSNPCDMGRSIELTCLAHRKFYRAQDSRNLRMRFDTIPVSKERYQRLSAPAQKALVKSLQKITAPFPFLQPPLVKTARGLERVEKLIELFEPFILHNEHDFEAEHIEWLSEALPEDEKSTFSYNSGSLDWYEYWINIHIPALRKWTYPLIEGRPLEMRARRNLDFANNGDAGNNVTPSSGTEGTTLRTGTGTTWQLS